VRKWLTYMALVIAAVFLICDLVAVLMYFLRGEVTSRFIAKSLIVLALSGGVFTYYYGGLKKTDEGGAHGGLSRDAWMAALATLAIVAMSIWGFFSLGAPNTQRRLRADASRVQNLYSLASEMNRRWNNKVNPEHKLPAELDELTNVRTYDPVTHAPYEYRDKGAGQYDLCAVFSLPSQQQQESDSRMWSHPAGHYCFSLDASREVTFPMLYYDVLP
jgi:hypothetical protein